MSRFKKCKSRRCSNPAYGTDYCSRLCAPYGNLSDQTKSEQEAARLEREMLRKLEKPRSIYEPEDWLARGR